MPAANQASTIEVHHMGDDGRSVVGQYRAQPATPHMSMLGRIGAQARQLAGPAVAPVIFACVCLALVYGRNRKRRKPVLHRSMSIAMLHGGEMALERMLDSQDARVSETALLAAEKEMKELLKEERIKFDELNRVAAKLEMSGKENEAIACIKEALEKALKDHRPHEAYELEMLLVEMLIYKGEPDKALGLKCLKEPDISDARAPLYKALCYALKNDWGNAKKCYDDFQELRRRFYSPETLQEDSPLYGLLHDYGKFKKIAENLMKEINLAKGAPKKT